MCVLITMCARGLATEVLLACLIDFDCCEFGRRSTLMPFVVAVSYP